MARTILFPLPDRDFDVTEVAVPWKMLRDAGHRVVFATESGKTPSADPLLLTGVLFGKLGAAPEAIGFYRELEVDGDFERPLAWSALVPEDFDALFLAGGHAGGMRQYLGSQELHEFIARFWRLVLPIGSPFRVRRPS